MSMNREDRIVLDQVRAVACTRTSALVTEVWFIPTDHYPIMVNQCISISNVTEAWKHLFFVQLMEATFGEIMSSTLQVRYQGLPP